MQTKWLQSFPSLYNPIASSPPGSSVHGNFPGKNVGVGRHSLLQGMDPGIEPALAGEFFPTEPPKYHLIC